MKSASESRYIAKASCLLSGLVVSAVISFLWTPTAFAQDMVLGGTVVTPDKVIADGWVVIRSGLIDSISTGRQPSGSETVVKTNGFIFPGLIDLHNHPMYNVFERWKPAGRFKNRYEWRDLPQYSTLIGKPGSDLQNSDDGTFCDVDEYSEVRALVGGTTAITGISARRTKDIPSSFTFAKSYRVLDNSPPALINQVGKNVSCPEIRRIKRHFKDVRSAHACYQEQSNSRLRI